MFSTIPTTGTLTRSNIRAPLSASPTAISCGVVTITAPDTATDCTSENCASPVPGGMSGIGVSFFPPNLPVGSGGVNEGPPRGRWGGGGAGGVRERPDRALAG